MVRNARVTIGKKGTSSIFSRYEHGKKNVVFLVSVRPCQIKTTCLRQNKNNPHQFPARVLRGLSPNNSERSLIGISRYELIVLTSIFAQGSINVNSIPLHNNITQLILTNHFTAQGSHCLRRADVAPVTVKKSNFDAVILTNFER